MPRYDYTCAAGHVHEHTFRMADKPAEVPCSTCSEPARDKGRYVCAVKVVAGRGEKPRYEGTVKQDTGPAEVHEHGGQSHDVRNVDLECTAEPACGQAKFWDVYDARTEAPAPCPTCGAASRVIIGAGPAQCGEFPRYDRGLGMWLQSAAHRRKVCKERGLIPVDGDYDEDRIMSAIENDRAAEDAIAADYYDRLENAPEYADFRRDRDAGVYDAVTKKEPPPPIQVVPRKPRLRGVRVP